MKPFKLYILSEDIKSKLRRLKNLSSKERNELIKFFQQNPHLEGKSGGIDWNNRNLVFSDFKDVMNKRSSRKIKKDVKKHGLKGLKEGKDYVDISYMFDYYNAYIPLNHIASQMFGTEYIGKCEGKWCTSGNRPASWNDYARQGVVIIILVSPDGKKKYAAATHDRLMDVEIYDSKGDEIKSVPHENVVSVIQNNKREIISYRNKIKTEKHKTVKWFSKAKVIDADYEVTSNNTIHWKNGTWLNGIWVDGVWEYGTWKKGTWRDGLWKGGLWEKGKWEYGTWEGDDDDSIWWDGLWVFGYHKGGTWENGDWLYGIWHDGIWEDGTWHGGLWVTGNWLGGKWKGGYDQYKNWHEEDDSPDKW